jgi:hypothetical protein
MKHSILLFAITSAVGICAPVDAHALGTETSCNSGSVCFHVTNSGAGDGLVSSATGGGDGLFGHSTSGFGVLAVSDSSLGVYAEGADKGVSGHSTNGMGVEGFSTNWNGVVGQNSRTDLTAAAISAIPGSTTGLAIYAGGVAIKPGGGAWSTFSDARLKKDVKGFNLGLAELKRLRPVTYKYNGLGKTQDDGNEFVGVIAQELEKVLPRMVKSNKEKLRPSDTKETDIKYVDPSAFTYVLINAVQEQQKIIERQEARIAKLERGDAPSGLPASVAGLALGLIPLGLIMVHRRRMDW